MNKAKTGRCVERVPRTGRSEGPNYDGLDNIRARSGPKMPLQDCQRSWRQRPDFGLPCLPSSFYYYCLPLFLWFFPCFLFLYLFSNFLFSVFLAFFVLLLLSSFFLILFLFFSSFFFVLIFLIPLFGSFAFDFCTNYDTVYICNESMIIYLLLMRLFAYQFNYSIFLIFCRLMSLPFSCSFRILFIIFSTDLTVFFHLFGGPCSFACIYRCSKQKYNAK